MATSGGPGVELSLADAHALWSRMPFPRKGSTPEVRGLYVDLAVADEHAAVVDSYLRTGRFRLAPTDVLLELGAVIADAEALEPRCSEEDQEVVREIHAFAVLLAIMYRLFLETGGPTG